jgi:hypothetical protein
MLAGAPLVVARCSGVSFNISMWHIVAASRIFPPPPLGATVRGTSRKDLPPRTGEGIISEVEQQ